MWPEVSVLVYFLCEQEVIEHTKYIHTGCFCICWKTLISLNNFIEYASIDSVDLPLIQICLVAYSADISLIIDATRFQNHGERLPARVRGSRGLTVPFCLIWYHNQPPSPSHDRPNYLFYYTAHQKNNSDNSIHFDSGILSMRVPYRPFLDGE